MVKYLIFSFSFISSVFAAEINCEALQNKYTCPGGAKYPIHLTFDDGPSPGRTELVLDALKKHDVTATFFVTGAKLDPKSSSYSEKNIRTLRKIIDGGFPIGSHGYLHEHHTKLSAKQLSEKLELARNAGVGVVVDGVRQGEFLSKPLLFRLPYGDGWHPLTTNPENNEQVMKGIHELGFTHVGWPHNGGSRGLHISDWARGKDYQDLLLKRICEFKGGIVLMHDIQIHTARGIDQWISAVKCLGHPIVSIDPFLKDEQSVQQCENVDKMKPPKAPSEVNSILEVIEHLGECHEGAGCEEHHD